MDAVPGLVVEGSTGGLPILHARREHDASGRDLAAVCEVEPEPRSVLAVGPACADDRSLDERGAPPLRVVAAESHEPFAGDALGETKNIVVTGGTRGPGNGGWPMATLWCWTSAGSWTDTAWT